MKWLRTLRRLLHLWRPRSTDSSVDQPATPEPRKTTQPTTPGTPTPPVRPPTSQTTKPERPSPAIAPTPTSPARPQPEKKETTTPEITSTPAPAAPTRPSRAERSTATPVGLVPPTTYAVIGLDFGTSGTKVGIRIPAMRPPVSVVDFGTRQHGFSRFSCPSTITLSGSRFLCGIEAEKFTNGLVFRSLKRKLLQTKGKIPRSGVAGSVPEPRELSAHPHFLVAIYLGTVLRDVHQLLLRKYNVDPEYFYNLDIPVSRLAGGLVQKGFQTVLDAAVEFAENRHSVLRDDYRILWKYWIEILERDSTGLADREHKRWELIPESSAIVKGAESALATILPNSHLYTAIVDVGAGTTDVGWFKWVRRDEEDCVNFFSAKTCLVGCDDIDNALLDDLEVPPNDRSREFPMVRAAKSMLATGESISVSRKYRQLSADDLDGAVRIVARQSFGEYGDSFGEAYKKDKNTDNWKDIRVILVGGGSQLDGFRRQFDRHPRADVFYYRCNTELILPGASAAVAAATLPKSIGATSKPPGRDDVVFLLPALGLANPAEDIPEPKLPDDIAPVPPSTLGPSGLYDYDAPDDD